MMKHRKIRERNRAVISVEVEGLLNKIILSSLALIMIRLSKNHKNVPLI